VKKTVLYFIAAVAWIGAAPSVAQGPKICSWPVPVTMAHRAGTNTNAICARWRNRWSRPPTCAVSRRNSSWVHCHAISPRYAMRRPSSSTRVRIAPRTSCIRCSRRIPPTNGRGYDPETTAYLKSLDELIREKKIGVVILHYASWAENWRAREYYLNWTGGLWVQIASKNPTDDWSMTLENRRHPILSGVKPWQYRDEIFCRYFLPDDKRRTNLLLASPREDKAGIGPQIRRVGLAAGRRRPRLRVRRPRLPRQPGARQLSPLPAEWHRLGGEPRDSRAAASVRRRPTSATSRPAKVE
jgi:hypothetical protein